MLFYINEFVFTLALEKMTLRNDPENGDTEEKSLSKPADTENPSWTSQAINQ